MAMTLVKEVASEAVLHILTVLFCLLLFAGITHRLGGTCGNDDAATAQASTRK